MQRTTTKMRDDLLEILWNSLIFSQGELGEGDCCYNHFVTIQKNMTVYANMCGHTHNATCHLLYGVWCLNTLDKSNVMYKYAIHFIHILDHRPISQFSSKSQYSTHLHRRSNKVTSWKFYECVNHCTDDESKDNHAYHIDTHNHNHIAFPCIGMTCRSEFKKFEQGENEMEYSKEKEQNGKKGFLHCCTSSRDRLCKNESSRHISPSSKCDNSRANK